MRNRFNCHATVFVVGDRGVMLRGPSGSGKTTLALATVAAAGVSGRHAALVADDQVWFRAAGERLLCEAPDAIAGLAEVRGLGPRPVPHQAGAVVDVVVELCPPEALPRLAEPQTVEIGGCIMPLFHCSERNVAASAIILSAVLGLPPFRKGSFDP